MSEAEEMKPAKKRCDNCTRDAEHTVRGGHDNSRIFYYCDRCKPPVGEHAKRI